ncbi:hypothetical protein MYAM1_003107 [Malassezia yamatoensis]|uniref:Uncharacterized protein n=1 Tax=Malassezia yamatoensis TaxID=253288 RepID=A0AAJ5YW35_9BASI|nr:hypothetical protein MYAM1_003107 [Malassezia yamatoensis]
MRLDVLSVHVLVPHKAAYGHVSFVVVIVVTGLHILAIKVFHLYLRLYYSKNVYKDSVEYGSQYAQNTSTIREVFLHAIGREPILIPTPVANDDDHRESRRFMHECDEQKNPLRCWRDRCKGHYRSPR